MKLFCLYEGVAPEPRSTLSGRIMSLRDKTKIIEKPAKEAGLDQELVRINELIKRAQKTK